MHIYTCIYTRTYLPTYICHFSFSQPGDEVHSTVADGGVERSKGLRHGEGVWRGFGDSWMKKGPWLVGSCCHVFFFLMWDKFLGGRWLGLIWRWLGLIPDHYDFFGVWKGPQRDVKFYTPRKLTWLAGKFPSFNRKYIDSNGGIFHCHVSFRGGLFRW